MTTFQGQSAKRHSNKKNFKSSQNQRNAIFIFITFRNHRQKILTLFHIYKCRRFRKSNQNRAPELGIPAEWQHSKVSRRNVTQTRKTSKAITSNKCYTHFQNFPESSAKNFNVVSHLQVSQIQKIKSKKGTATWNLNRMTTFQGQLAKRHSNKKKFKSGQNQPNAIFIFITFRNHRQKILTLFHIYKCRRFRKSNQKRAPELGIPAEWQHFKVSWRNVTQTRKT